MEVANRLQYSCVMKKKTVLLAGSLPKKKKMIWLVFTIMILLLTAYINRQQVFELTNIDYYTNLYSQSQYILGDAAVQQISDGDLYVYAGYAYLNGEDPTTINFEHPPLAKYIYGLSYRLFSRAKMLNLVMYLAVLLIFVRLSSFVTDNQKVQALALIVFSSLALVRSQPALSLLDMPLLISIMSLFVLLFRGWQKISLKYLCLGVCLGFIASIKYPFPSMFLPVGIVVIHSWFKKELKYFGLVIPGLLGIYLLSYLMFFLHDHSFIDFINFEKYRFSWWVGGRTAPKWLILSSLIFGQYKAWWQDGLTISSPQWWQVWLPVLFFTGTLAWIRLMVTRFTQLIDKSPHEVNIFILGLYMSGQLLMYGYGAASDVRYLLQLVPFWILLSMIWFVPRKMTSN